jgi:cytidine deaminase
VQTEPIEKKHADLSNLQLDLIHDAKRAKRQSQPQVSGYQVGAALMLCPKYPTFRLGCNTEFSIHTACVHAEIAATQLALFDGLEDAVEIAVAVDGEPYYPCGLCRQILAEKWGPALKVIAVGTKGVIDWIKCTTIRDLLPQGFRI